MIIIDPEDQDSEPSREVLKMALSLHALIAHSKPTAWELLAHLESEFGPKARWLASDAIDELRSFKVLSPQQLDYLYYLVTSEEWRQAVRGVVHTGKEIESTIDALLRESEAYRSSKAFQELVSFMAKFRDYAPFNNMLVKLQRPSCTFYATQNDWQKRFDRTLRLDARPIVILAPRHPVMFVYELDSTEGPPLPEALQKFSRFEGQWNSARMERTIDNARHRDLIQIDRVPLSSTNAGFATIARGGSGRKMRIALHDQLDEPSQYGVLLHELAHIYLGHLGGDEDGWWPARGDLDHNTVEVEAEAVAYIVSSRAGLRGASAQYVSGYLKEGQLPCSVSIDLIAKVAGRLEEMATETMPARKKKKKHGGQGRELDDE